MDLLTDTTKTGWEKDQVRSKDTKLKICRRVKEAEEIKSCVERMIYRVQCNRAKQLLWGYC